MAYLTTVLVFFCAAVTIHILYCRSTPAAGLHAKLFCRIAFVLFALAVWVVDFSPAFRGFSEAAPFDLWTLPVKAASYLIYLLLVPVYLIFYVTTQLNSPTKMILQLMTRKPSVSRAEILAELSDEVLVKPRLEELMLTGCVVKEDGRCRLTASGISIARFLNLYQWILGRKVGG